MKLVFVSQFSAFNCTNVKLVLLDGFTWKRQHAQVYHLMFVLMFLLIKCEF